MNPQSSPLLSCQSLSCGYGSHRVLDGVEFDLEAGTILALLGANGSGKSTLIKTLASLLAPLGGSVVASGTEIGRLRPRELAARLSYVPQNESAAFDYTVREVVLTGRFWKGSGMFESAEDITIAEQSMERTDCLRFADQPASQLSGGEHQRVLLARALAQESPVMLLDEPTAHLDPSHQVAVARLLAELASEGKAIIAAIHDLNWASVIADRAVLLDAGVIAYDGPMDALLWSDQLEHVYRTPFNRFDTPNFRPRVFPRFEA